MLHPAMAAALAGPGCLKRDSCVRAAPHAACDNHEPTLTLHDKLPRRIDNGCFDGTPPEVARDTAGLKALLSTFASAVTVALNNAISASIVAAATVTAAAATASAVYLSAESEDEDSEEEEEEEQGEEEEKR